MGFRTRMMARLALLGGICLTTMATQYSCSSDGTGMISDRDIGSGNGPTFSTTLILRDSAGAESHHFRRMELMDFELTVRNRTADEVTVDMPAPVGAEFLIFREGTDTLRWRSLEDHFFPAVITSIVFAPHEEKKFELTWNQETRDGT